MNVKVKVNLPYKIHPQDQAPMNTPHGISHVFVRSALTAKHKEVKERSLQRTLKRILDAASAVSDPSCTAEDFEISHEDARVLQKAVEEFPCQPLLTSWFVLFADALDDAMTVAAKDVAAAK